MADFSQTLAELMQIAQSAGGVGGAPTSAATPQFAGGASPASGGQPKWMQAIGQYAPYALAGMAGGAKGGVAGALTAAAVAGLVNQLKQQKPMNIPMDTKIATDDGLRKGGGVNAKGFSGQMSKKLAQKPVAQKPVKKADGGGIEAAHAVSASRQLARVPAMRSAIPHAPVFRTRTGRFAKGGLVRGAGAEIRGNRYYGEC